MEGIAKIKVGEPQNIRKTALKSIKKSTKKNNEALNGCFKGLVINFGIIFMLKSFQNPDKNQ